MKIKKIFDTHEYDVEDLRIYECGKFSYDKIKIYTKGVNGKKREHIFSSIRNLEFQKT